MSTQKNRLIVLSDMWGTENANWLTEYTKGLNNHFEVVLYDSCLLGKVTPTPSNPDYTHQQFTENGIDKAVQQLIELEPDPVHVLAFSVGGTIGWKYGLKTDNIKALCALSSTRLRMESTQPSSEILLYFGTNDVFKPNSSWFKTMHIDFQCRNNMGHAMYKDYDFIKKETPRIFNFLKNK